VILHDQINDIDIHGSASSSGQEPPRTHIRRTHHSGQDGREGV
jgi:hypothetical protein